MENDYQKDNEKNDDFKISRACDMFFYKKK